MRIPLSTTLLLPFAALAAFTTLAALAQPAPPQPAPTVPPASRVSRGPVLTDDQGQPVQGVQLSKADVRAVIHGSLAQATMTLTFANSENRVLGGELVFPLPEGATVTGYGLEINGSMVDGVAVEKQQARVIYEKELHKRVDPGLVEQAAGNAFRTRLYPVPANGSRSIKIQYVTEVSSTKQGTTLSLPMGWGGKVDSCTVRIDAPDAGAEPSVKSAGAPGLAFRKAEHGYAAEGELKDAPEELVVALPEMAERSVAVEKRLRATATIEDLDEQAKGGEATKRFEQFEHYFLINDTPPAPPAPEMKASSAKAPASKEIHRLAILWDAGLSRAEADKGRELHLLEQLLKQWPQARADLVVFRDTAEKPVSFDLSKADGRGQVIETLSRLTYDGASDLGHLPLPRNLNGFTGGAADETTGSYDCLLLFTDGLGGVGPEVMRNAEAPVYAFSDDQRANHAMLRQVCRESGGAYLNLKRLGDEQAMDAVGKEPYSLVSVDFKPEQVAEVYPAAGVPVQGQGRVAVSGRLLVPEAAVTLNYGYGRKITHSQPFTLKASGATAGELIPRYWAQQKVAELSLRPGANDEELSKVGKQFNLVTSNTSLLVLESAEQYVQYRVVPPRSQPEIYKQFLAQIERNKVQEQQTKEQKLQQVLAMWDGRVKWWEQQFNYPKDLKVNPAQESGPGLATNLRAGDTVASGRDLGDAGNQPLARGGRQAGADHSPVAHTAAPAPLPMAPSAGAAAPPATPQVAERGRAIDDQPGASADPGRPGGGGGAGGVGAASPARQPQQPADRLQHHFEQVSRQQLQSEQASQPRPLVSAGQDGAVGNENNDAAFFDLNQARRKLEGTKEDGTSGAAVTIKPWDPSTPYLSAMKSAGAEKAYGVYLEQRKTFGKSPAFYLDCGDFLERIGQHALAVRVLSDVAALRLADARLLRVAAHRLQQIGERGRAIELFERVLRMRPEEPQSHRDLALAVSDRADALAELPKGDSRRDSGAIAADYGRCLTLLNEVIEGRWDRFQEIELPCLMEANRVIARVKRLQQAGEVSEVPVPLDARLVKNLECDLRVVMTWDADNTDIDLWVTEPSGEKCFYGHNRTIIGGLLSRDFTDGYGPEEYCLRKLMAGKYLIQANFYGSRQQELTGPATVAATVYTDFGRPTEHKQSLTLRLASQQEVVDIGTVSPAAPGKAPQVKKAGKVDAPEKP